MAVAFLGKEGTYIPSVGSADDRLFMGYKGWEGFSTLAHFV